MAHVFEPDALHEVARELVGVPYEDLFSAAASRLERLAPGHVEHRCNWIFNNAGGAMGQLALLHASLSEYIILFGSPIGTEGHSGRYRTEVYDFQIAGETWCYLEGEMQRTVYKPGDVMYLGPAQVKGYRIPDFSWMLEYHASLRSGRHRDEHPRPAQLRPHVLELRAPDRARAPEGQDLARATRRS
jgi:hypothetical protein